ncbi:MAG: MOSC domain-containing protein [Crocinitomicaceae bacterium]
MKVANVNIGKKQTVSWRGKPVETGIFKHPQNQPIRLESEDVLGDAVVDRRYHGGIDKACYLYSADHYAFWQSEFPEVDWQDGMMGENITIEGLSEKRIQIGDIYAIGDALVQVTQPRQPCFKLGIRVGTQKIIKAFINNPYPGVYVKVIREGEVKKGDDFQLRERLHNSIGLLEVWDLLYKDNYDEELMEFAIEFQHLADECKDSLRKRMNKE